MSYLLDALAIALLAFIAAELYLLRRDLLWIAGAGSRVSEEAHPKGQTINVNVGAAVSSEPASAAKAAEPLPAPEEEEAKIAAEAEKEKEEAERAAAEERERRAVERARIDSSAVRATPSGLLVKKCPGCGMENTSYRTECFNCGGRL